MKKFSKNKVKKLTNEEYEAIKKNMEMMIKQQKELQS